MTQQQNLIDRWSVYSAAGKIAYSSVKMFAIMPIAVSAIQRHYGFKEGQLGDIVACYFAGVTAVSLTAFAWVRRYDWRMIATTGQVIAAVSLFAAMSARDFGQLATLMATAGIGSGITFAMLLTLLGDSSNPDKAYAINLFIQATLATLMILLLPMAFSNDASDMRRLSIAMGGAVLVMSIGVPWLPRSGRKQTSRQQPSRSAEERWNLWWPILGTVATFCFATSYTAPWTFIEQAGAAKGLDPVLVGFCLAGAQFASILGSIVAALISNRYGQLRPVCIGVAVYLIGIYFLDIFHNRDTFAFGTFLFFLPSNFLLAYSLGLTAEVDAGGRLLGLSTASMLGPSLLAPAIAGRLYEKYGFASNLLMGLISIVVGLMLFVWLLRAARLRRGVRDPGAATSNTSHT
jgi:predicted MFS family arabinose efflux permease